MSVDRPLSTESMRRVFRLSPAAIGRYRTCPKRFWFQDVIRMRVEAERSPVLAQANAVHHALERFFGLPDGDRSVASLHRALRAVWPRHRAGAFAGREEEAHYGREALEMLSRFAECFDLAVQPLAREHRVQLKLKDGTRVVGKIDRVDPSPSGEGIEVLDYKTGRRMLEPEDIRQEPAAQLYVLAAESLFGLPVTRVRLVYLRQGEDVSWSPEREDVDMLRERLLRACAEIATATEFPATPGPHCDWCPYQLHCDERKQVALSDLVVPVGIPF